MENVGTAATYMLVVVTTLASAKVKEWWDERQSRRVTEQSLKACIKTQTFLGQVLDQTDCDRITISQFHNGDYFASGASVQKVTLTHYAMKDGISGPMDTAGFELRSTPATFMTRLLDKAFSQGYYMCRDFNPEDPWVARYQMANGLRTVVVCLIPGQSAQETFGLMAFCWLKSWDVPEEKIKTFVQIAKRASAYL